MQVLGEQVWLAENEVRRLTRLTGESPAPRMTMSRYNDFLDRHLKRLSGATADEQIQRYLIEQQRFTRLSYPYRLASPSV